DLEPGSLLVAKGGREILVEGSAAAVYEERGNFAGFVLTFRDVTGRTRAEEAMRQSQKMEALGRLAGGMARDFNQLLTTILGNLSLVLTNVPRSDLNREFLVSAERAALAAGEMVKQLLGFANPREARLEVTCLNTAIEEMVEFVRWFLEPRVTLTFNPAADPRDVQADPVLLREALLNLCLYARDAAPQGGRVVIETENVDFEPTAGVSRPGARGGAYVCLRVRHTGTEILPQDRARIFEPFFVTKEPGKPAGLGLALVFGIVQEHGGWIDCRSEPDRGTSFDIY